ncbi:hypothetical protein D3C74_59980 [compost metagenome]
MIDRRQAVRQNVRKVHSGVHVVMYVQILTSKVIRFIRQLSGGQHSVPLDSEKFG